MEKPTVRVASIVEVLEEGSQEMSPGLVQALDRLDTVVASAPPTLDEMGAKPSAEMTAPVEPRNGLMFLLPEVEPAASTELSTDPRF